MSTPVSPKVTAATVTAAVVSLIMYALSGLAFVADMPSVVAGALLVVVTAGVTFVAGYATRDPLRAMSRTGRRRADDEFGAISFDAIAVAAAGAFIGIGLLYLLIQAIE